MGERVKLCAKDTYDPCPWRRKRKPNDGIRMSCSMHRCASKRGCMWEYWEDVDCKKGKDEMK